MLLLRQPGFSDGRLEGGAPPLQLRRPFSRSVRAAALYILVTESVIDPRRFTP